MDPQLANALFEKCAFILFLDAPERLSFGMDLQQYTTDTKFMGMKLIPPGLHCVHYGLANPHGGEGLRTGFWHFFQPNEIVIKRWNPVIEDCFPDDAIDEEERNRYRANIRNLDQNLGAYPLMPPMQTYTRWQRLTSYITPTVLQRVLPAKGFVTSATCPEPPPGTSSTNAHNVDSPAASNSASSIPSVTAHFSEFDLKRSFPKGATPETVTKYSLDKSWLLEHVIKTSYEGDYKQLLAELQLSFLCLFLVHNFSGLEHWKNTISVICMAKEAVMGNMMDMVYEFVDVLESQLMECPKDLFLSVITEGNFLSGTLTTLTATVRTHSNRSPSSEAAQESMTPSRLSALRTRLERFRNLVRKEFQWDIGPAERDGAKIREIDNAGQLHDESEDEEEEEGEYAPVVVET